jgi:Flp pilus assembly protein TadD
MREAVPEAPRPDPLVARKTAPAALLAGAGVRPTSKRPSGRLARHSSAPRGLTQVELDLAAFDEVRALGLAGRHMEGLRKLEPIAKRCPSSREAWTLRGQILFALAQYEPALASVERVIKIDAKDQDALRLMIKILTATKKDVRALEMASLLVSLAPRDAEAHRLHADCLVGAMHHGEAVAVYEKVILLVPDDPLPWLGLGRTLRQLRRPAEARMALSKARALAEASGQADVVAQAVELLAKLPAA